MSVCEFPDEFTCKSGTCVDIFKRCDHKKDCDDGSDEEDCTMLRIPESYDKSLPPELGDDVEKPNDIYTQVRVINVDSINTVTMVVELTIELTLKWRDHDINYENVKNSKEEGNTFKIIPIHEKDKIWLPFQELVHDNAIIGETKSVIFYQLGVEVENDPEPGDTGEPRETLIYRGKDNMLVATQRMKLKYRCEFFLLYFPFDDTNCDFYLSIRTVGNNSIRLTNDENSVIYNGPSVLHEFEIINFWSETSHSDTKTSFIYSFEFQRLFVQHLMTTFFQSFLLWVLAYITLFINEEDFSNRFMGAVTSLLVLAALLSSLGDLLPKTAYIKFVDLWFNWFIVNIFFIILIHVLIDYKSQAQNSKVSPPMDKEQQEIYEQVHNEKVKQVRPQTPLFNKLHLETQVKTPKNIGVQLNNICKIVIPALTGLFISFYFTYIVIHSHDMAGH